MRTPTIVIGLAALTGVAAAQAPQRLAPAVTSAASANLLTVQNRRAVPVTVYVESGSFDRRLGVVPAFETSTLALPTWALGARGVKLFARPDGSVRDLASEEFRVTAPARVAMVIPPHASHADEAPAPMTATLSAAELSAATLTVDNPRAAAVTVFATQGAFDVRLGRVPAGARATLRFPRAAVAGGSLRLFVRPDGGDDLASETLTVGARQHLGLRVPPA